MLRASELADKLGVSKGRISQLVADGKLSGCFDGEGHGRRFDLAKCAEALGRRLDQGQMLGNGAGTRRALRSIAAGAAADPIELPAGRKSEGAAPLQPNDPDRYELARAAKAEEDLRAMRLRNGREEGLYVLATEVSREVSQAIGQEVREVETYLREVARTLADRLAIDFKSARQILMDGWREHRKGRSTAMAAEAEQAPMSDAERAADI